MISYNKIQIDGLEIFYREAGSKSDPTFLLLHGFPSASHMFRDLIPLLEDQFHIIAPDYPGFGQSEIPSREKFSYTFNHLSEIVEKFLQTLEIDRFFIYVFDYGAPIGFRIAMKNPNSILGIVSQNGNVYREGLGEKWKARAEYWKNPTPKLREQFKSAFAAETIIGQYTFGTESGIASPCGYSLDIFY